MTRSLLFLRILQRTRHELPNQLPRIRVVDPHDAVEAGGSNFLAVGAEGDGVDRAALAFELRDRLGVVGIEDTHLTLVVMAGADDDPAAVLIETAIEDAAGQCREGANEVEVVADLAVL